MLKKAVLCGSVFVLNSFLTQELSPGEKGYQNYLDKMSKIVFE